MATKRKSIKLDEHERATLIDLYVEKAIPVDQYDERREELGELQQEWSRLTGRDNSPNDLFHYMRNQRKNGKWVRLNGKHVKRNPQVTLTAEETELLVEIYREHVASIATGTDAIGYDEEITALIAKEFSVNARRVLPGSDLIAALTALRKRGLLPRIEKQVRDDDELGFSDIDLATG